MKKILLAAICVVLAAATVTGCGIAKRPSENDAVYSDNNYSDYNSDDTDDGYTYYGSGREKKSYSILTDPSEYEHGYSSPQYQPRVHDSRYDNALFMCDYEGSTYSCDYADLEFILTSVSDDGNTIEVMFTKNQYELTGIDLGAVYTGTLAKIQGGSFTTMDGYYSYEFPFMDEWEDGSRHPDTFLLEFSFGSTDPQGEFCMSQIGLLGNTLYII